MAHSITIEQEENAAMIATELFEKKITSDFWHFSFEGLRLNLITMNLQCTFEVHSEKGSFNCFLDLNEKIQVIIKSFILDTI